MKRSILSLFLIAIMQLSCNKKDAHNALLAEYLTKDSWKVVEYSSDNNSTPEDSAFIEDVKNYKFEFNDPDLLKATNINTNNVLNGTWSMFSDSALTLDFGSVRLAASGTWEADTITQSRVATHAATYYLVRMVLAKSN